jgi:hypothetical protein
MDYSAEQQQQQQHYQHQHYQPEQPQSQQSYDPSQYQAYYASYNTNNQQQQYQYYPSHDYATTAASSYQQPHQYHPESASIHPPGVPLPPDPTLLLNPAVYYPQQHQSNLSQFPANFDAAQTSMHPPVILYFALFLMS